MLAAKATEHRLGMTLAAKANSFAAWILAGRTGAQVAGAEHRGDPNGAGVGPDARDSAARHADPGVAAVRRPAGGDGQYVTVGGGRAGRGDRNCSPEVVARSGPYSSPARPRSGARTPEGLKRCRRATSKHDGRSAEVITLQRLRGEARRQRQHLCALIRQAEAVLDQPAGG